MHSHPRVPAGHGDRRKEVTALLSARSGTSGSETRIAGTDSPPARSERCRAGEQELPPPPPGRPLLVALLPRQQLAAHRAAPGGHRGAARRFAHLQRGRLSVRSAPSAPRRFPPPRAQTAALPATGPRHCRPSPFCSRAGCRAASPSPRQPAVPARPPSPPPLWAEARLSFLPAVVRRPWQASPGAAGFRAAATFQTLLPSGESEAIGHASPHEHRVEALRQSPQPEGAGTDPCPEAPECHWAAGHWGEREGTRSEVPLYTILY